MTNVGHDGGWMDSRYKRSGMTQKKNIPLAIFSKGTCQMSVLARPKMKEAQTR